MKNIQDKKKIIEKRIDNDFIKKMKIVEKFKVKKKPIGESRDYIWTTSRNC